MNNSKKLKKYSKEGTDTVKIIKQVCKIFSEALLNKNMKRPASI